MFEMIKRFVKEEKGQGMAEYGLILALVAVVLVGALVTLSGGIESIFGQVNTELTTPR